MSQTAPPKSGQPALRSSFQQAAIYLKNDKGIQPLAIATGILLGTTALATPLLGSMLGAGLAMAAGIGLLIKTSDTVVDHAAAFGKKAGVPSMMLGIGLGLLTSLPELCVSAAAVLSGTAALGIGNITGSNVANLLLILGSTTMVRKIEATGTSWKFNAVAMGASTLAFGAQMVMGALNPAIGGLMLAGLGLYLWRSYALSKKDHAQDQTAPESQAPQETQASSAEKTPLWFNLACGLAGVAGLVGSAAFVVSSATAFGIAAGISPAVVGVLAVAVGTSLPELMVNIKAARSGNANMAIGNVLGSNVFNLLMIGGLLSLTGIAVPADLNPRETVLGFVNTAAFGLSALAGWAAMKAGNGKLDRRHGIAGLTLYAAYTVANVLLGQSASPPAPDAVTPMPPPAPIPPSR